MYEFLHSQGQKATDAAQQRTSLFDHLLGGGEYAIRALPDLCFGIASGRLGVKLIFPPDHSGHLLRAPV